MYDSDSGLSFSMDTTSTDGKVSQKPQKADSPNEFVSLKIVIPDLEYEKTFSFPVDISIGDAKQFVMKRLSRPLRDPHNYSLFLPPTNGKAGKFLQEERTMREYSLDTSQSHLQLRYKCRIYKAGQTNQSKLKKLHNKTNIRLFLEYMKTNDIVKATKLLNKGLDPNFHCKDGIETPLSIVTQLSNPKDMILALVNGGAHLDYRTKDGMTPLHKAAIYGNHEAIKLLLDLGQSANCKDERGLTPLYHAICHDAPSICVERLLFDHSVLGLTDEQGLQEIHHSCRKGNVQHLEHLIYYGADLNSQSTKNGNSPLHICAYFGQESCARLLLFRGANRRLQNRSGHTPYQLAVISEHSDVAKIIKEFREEDIVPFRGQPKYNEKRRGARLTSNSSGCNSVEPTNAMVRSQSLGRLNGVGTSSQTGSSSQQPKQLSASVTSRNLAGSATPQPPRSNPMFDNGSRRFGALLNRGKNCNGTSPSAENIAKSFSGKSRMRSKSITGETELDNGVEDSLDDWSSSGLSSPRVGNFDSPRFHSGNEEVVDGGSSESIVQYRCKRNNAFYRFSDDGNEADDDETLKRHKPPGCSRPSSIETRREDSVTSLNHSYPLIQQSALKYDYPRSQMNSSGLHLVTPPSSQWNDDCASVSSISSSIQSQSTNCRPPSFSGSSIQSSSAYQSFNSKAPFDILNLDLTNIPRSVVIQRGDKGEYGFVVRGLKVRNPEEFQSTMETPAMQYLERVEEGSPAEKAGLKPGDYLLEINGCPVIRMPHSQAVSLIKQTENNLALKVISVNRDRLPSMSHHFVSGISPRNSGSTTHHTAALLSGCASSSTSSGYVAGDSSSVCSSNISYPSSVVSGGGIASSNPLLSPRCLNTNLSSPRESVAPTMNQQRANISTKSSHESTIYAKPTHEYGHQRSGSNSIVMEHQRRNSNSSNYSDYSTPSTSCKLMRSMTQPGNSSQPTTAQTPVTSNDITSNNPLLTFSSSKQISNMSSPKPRSEFDFFQPPPPPPLEEDDKTVDESFPPPPEAMMADAGMRTDVSDVSLPSPAFSSNSSMDDEHHVQSIGPPSYGLIKTMQPSANTPPPPPPLPPALPELTSTVKEKPQQQHQQLSHSTKLNSPPAIPTKPPLSAPVNRHEDDLRAAIARRREYIERGNLSPSEFDTESEDNFSNASQTLLRRGPGVMSSHPVTKPPPTYQQVSSSSTSAAIASPASSRKNLFQTHNPGSRIMAAVEQLSSSAAYQSNSPSQSPNMSGSYRPKSILRQSTSGTNFIASTHSATAGTNGSTVNCPSSKLQPPRFEGHKSMQV